MSYLDLLGDAGWRAALTIFTGRLLRDRNEVWDHIDLNRRSIQSKQMLKAAGPMSSGEYALIEVALSLFNQDKKVNLWDALAGLDDGSALLVVDAVANFSAYTGAHPMRRREEICVVLERKAGVSS